MVGATLAVALPPVQKFDGPPKHENIDR